MSKFGHKGGANCLCIFPKTMYMRKAVLLVDFTSWRTRDHPCLFVTTDKLAYADSRAADNKQREGKTRPVTLGEDALKPITLGINAEARPGTFTGDDEGVKFFAIYSVPVLWHTNENIRIRKRAFGVKRMGVLQINGRACERALCANFFLRGTVVSEIDV